MITTTFQDGVLTLEEVSKTFPVMGRRPTGGDQGVDCGDDDDSDYDDDDNGDVDDGDDDDDSDYGGGVDNDDEDDGGDYRNDDDKEKTLDIFCCFRFW